MYIRVPEELNTLAEIFKKNKGGKPFISEKSVIRPNFTYIGNYYISVNVFRQIAEYNVNRMEEVHKATKLTADNYSDGVFINVDVILNYGYPIKETLIKLKRLIKDDIEKYTSMNVFDVIVTAKSINTDSIGR